MHASADPRHFQIATLFSLLILLIFWRGQSVNAEVFCGILTGGLLAQWAGTRRARLAKLELKSALVSCLSLMLLLKTNHWGWAMGAAAFAIGSKFLFRAQNRHLFNPTNLGLAAALLCTDQVWLSHGQWGHGPFWVLFAGCTGTFVLFLARRSDVTLAFIGFWAALLLGRAAYLGDPWSIPAHSLQNGALLIFAFFMISDPKTTPDARLGRIVYAGLVAITAYVLQYHFYNPNGLIYALAFLSPVTLLINRWAPGQTFRWPNNARSPHRRFPQKVAPAGVAP